MVARCESHYVCFWQNCWRCHPQCVVNQYYKGVTFQCIRPKTKIVVRAQGRQTSSSASRRRQAACYHWSCYNWCCYQNGVGPCLGGCSGGVGCEGLLNVMRSFNYFTKVQLLLLQTSILEACSGVQMQQATIARQHTVCYATALSAPELWVTQEGPQRPEVEELHDS